MLRKDWGFDYTATKLAEAAASKMVFHKERLDWWKTKRQEVMGTIRSEGLEIDEKIVMEFRNPKARDWDRSAQVLIRNDLLKQKNHQLALCSWMESGLGFVNEYQSSLAGPKEFSNNRHDGRFASSCICF